MLPALHFHPDLPRARNFARPKHRFSEFATAKSKSGYLGARSERERGRESEIDEESGEAGEIKIEGP